jgi:hypothetical protein
LLFPDGEHRARSLRLADQPELHGNAVEPVQSMVGFHHRDTRLPDRLFWFHHYYFDHFFYDYEYNDHYNHINYNDLPHDFDRRIHFVFHNQFFVFVFFIIVFVLYYFIKYTRNHIYFLHNDHDHSGIDH